MRTQAFPSVCGSDFSAVLVFSSHRAPDARAMSPSPIPSLRASITGDAIPTCGARGQAAVGDGRIYARLGGRPPLVRLPARDAQVLQVCARHGIPQAERRTRAALLVRRSSPRGQLRSVASRGLPHEKPHVFAKRTAVNGVGSHAAWAIGTFAPALRSWALTRLRPTTHPRQVV